VTVWVADMDAVDNKIGITRVMNLLLRSYIANCW
jgi:hypothetical protein